MKKSLITIISCVLVFYNLYAQNPDKIKGNRIVSLVNTEVSSFHTIALDEDFEVDIIYNKIPSVEIETDENLHEFIEFIVKDSVLYFNKTKKITSKKQLSIKVIYDDYLQHIHTTDKAELNSLTPIEMINGTLKTNGSSRVALTLKSEYFEFKGAEKSKVKLNLTADSCAVNLQGNSKIEALINTPKLYAALKDKSDADIEGNCDTANIELDDNTLFNGRNFTIDTCSITANTSSDAYLEVIKNLTINATGTSSIYLYQNPKIIIDGMTDTTKLQKKVK
ncbi:DUF2807 domain-containing protein [Postechiella marina]|uniref:DUF2807 domain-containing protein n=1 Tax=Postechiella marina TaxID=943941 RepID=A0ABP8CIJ4_9FLAO